VSGLFYFVILSFDLIVFRCGVNV